MEQMGSVNKVILVGNLTRNPEMKQSEGKKPVCIMGAGNQPVLDRPERQKA
jgi:single-stranded DNA-binding protein